MAFAFLRSRKAKIALALIVANEIRGLCVAAAVLAAMHGRVL